MPVAPASDHSASSPDPRSSTRGAATATVSLESASVGNAAALRAALRRLEPDDARVLELMYFAALPLERVAGALSEEVRVVRRRVGRAMVELGRVLLGDDPTT